MKEMGRRAISSNPPLLPRLRVEKYLKHIKKEIIVSTLTGMGLKAAGKISRLLKTPICCVSSSFVVAAYVEVRLAAGSPTRRRGRSRSLLVATPPQDFGSLASGHF
jgi:hypothetical protein